jgi:glycosyltransferase involved in cell wall biosynthesis
MGDDLWVIVPVYNEGAAAGTAVREWYAAVRALCPDAVFCLVDDGSTDDTPAVLASVAAAVPAVRVLRQDNAGHGQACASGYRTALEAGARWVLQVDSDGQCDPAGFARLWSARDGQAAVFGHRRRRQDGLARTVISRALTLVVYASTGVWVRDANSPYRLMRADALADALPRVGRDVYLANVLVAVELEAGRGITWVDVGFRRRFRPSPFRPRYFLVQAIGLWRNLRRWRSDTRRARSRAIRGA